jgi:hypothetical protein
MGPKKSGGEVKAEKKKQEKIIEDKTFGLKNKNKSKAVQKYIKGVESTVKNKRGGAEDKGKEFQEKAEKKKKKEEDAFLNSLYKTVKTIKQADVGEGEEAKNILCEFFKAGCCEKGDNCEFSHDVNIHYNQGQIDIYTDLREIKKNMGMESEINKIAEEKEKKRSKMPQSNIVCKHFLDAVIKKVYGWKWECPNGEDCHYKHYLPKGYILATKEKTQEEMTLDEYYNLEEQIDAERERIGKSGIPVNDATFAEWKRKRDAFRKEKTEFEDKKKKNIQTGIQLFKTSNIVFKDDENAEDVVIDENNQEEQTQENQNNKETAKTEKEILDELENELKGIKINTDLFKGEENLDELNEIEEDDNEINHKDDENYDEDEDN